VCGIVAYSGNGADRRLFVELCRQSCVRGVHAFGIAYPTEGRLAVVKSTDFRDVTEAIPDPLPNKIIWHNRYSTSGDFKVMANNQPIIHGRSAMAFNGTIDMGTKESMEKRFGVHLNTANDGELLLLGLEQGNPFLYCDEGATIAAVYLNADGRMCAVRNELRPLWRFHADNGDFIVSTRDIASRARLGINNCAILEPMKIVEL